MPVKSKKIVSFIEKLAPLNLAESWDNCGWQVGNPEQEVNKVLVALDMDEKVLDEALNKGVHLVICHHPLIMKGLKNIRLDSSQGRLIGRLIKNDIGVYAAHTNLDSSSEGVNYVLAKTLGLQDVQVLHVVQKEKYLKLVVFVPESNLEEVMDALRSEGAGWIGNYSDCTFQIKGTGTFRPGEGTNPYIGKQGNLEQVEEIRLETIVPVNISGRVVETMIKAHPYEEVAYDLYPLALEGQAKGLGLVGNLPSPIKFVDFINVLKQKLKCDSLRYGGNEEEMVERIAVCGGSGADLWPAARSRRAQVLVTGDIKYHNAKDMLEEGIKFVDPGHYGTENPVVEYLQNYLQQCVVEEGMDVEIVASQRCCDPFKNS